MKIPVIAVPLKQTDPVDWTSALRSYLAAHYGLWSDFADEIAEFSKLRNEMAGCNLDAVGLSFYSRYYVELDQLDQRVSARDRLLNVLFSWRDAFDSTERSQHSIAFEKACVLFNFAALHLVVAADQYHGHAAEESDPKAAVAGFQNAASVFQYVSENFLHAPSNDLHQTLVVFLTKLMMAQAQEAFVAGAVARSKHSLLAKLFQGASAMYSACHELVQSMTKESVFPSSHQNWSNVVQAKRHYYAGLASYHMAHACEEASKHGDAIAYLLKAQTELREARSVALVSQDALDFPVLKIQAKELLEKIDKEKMEFEKDNDYIYHEVVPQSFTLAAIKPMEAVKPAKFDAVLAAPALRLKNVQPLFQRIIPMKVHEYNLIYSEEKAKHVRLCGERVDIAANAVKLFYAHLGLPKSFASIRAMLRGAPSTDSEFEDVLSQIKSLMAQTQADKEISFAVLQSKRNAVLDAVQACEAALRALEQNNLLDSAIAVMDIRSDLIRIKKSLVDTETSDRQITESFVAIEQLYRLFRKGAIQEIKGFFSAPEAASVSLLEIDDSAQNQAELLIKKIDQGLSQLAYLDKETQAFFDKYKAKVHADDISNVLVANKGMLEDQIRETIFPKELEKFEPYEERITNMIATQEGLMETITRDFAALDRNGAVVEKKRLFALQQKQKLGMFEKVNDFKSKYESIQTGLEMGKKFYDELLEFVVSLEGRAKSLITNRPTTLEDLNDRLARLNLSASTPTTTTTNSNIYSSDFNNQNKYTSISATPWSQTPLIPKKSSISNPTSTPVSYYQAAVAPAAPPAPSNLQNLSNLYGAYGDAPSLPPKGPPMQQQQTGIPFYNTPANFDASMYSKFSEQR